MTEPFITEEQELNRVVLSKLSVACKRALSPQVAASCEWSALTEAITGDMILSVRAHLYGEELGRSDQQVEFTFPATWWDCLKRDLHRTMSRRCPIRRTRLRLRWRFWRLVAIWLQRHPIRLDARVAHVHFEGWDTFPDMSRIFPEEFGAPRRRIITYTNVEREER